MERRIFGKTDMEVSVLGYGTSEIAYLDTPQEEIDELLGSALDAGLNVIDTAECYPGAEEKIGKAVSHRRKDFYLFSKCGHADSEDNLPDFHPDLLTKQIERSLSRLQTDHLDLMQLHTCPLELLQQGDVLEVLLRAKEAGKVRYIGSSADNEAATYSIECGQFDALQISVNIADQAALEKNVPLALATNMGVIAKRPVANVAWQNGDQPPSRAYAVPYWERLKKLDYAFMREAESEAVFRTALLFTVGQAGVHTAIVGTTKPGRWQENATHLSHGPLANDKILAIRDRWEEMNGQEWPGLT